MHATSASAVPPTLNPERFIFWRPAQGRSLPAAGDQPGIPLPGILLPINRTDWQEGEPTDAVIGQGLYDYLRQFPDCPHNTVYAELLRDAFPHFLTDLAAQAVMLDAKDPATAHVKRKLTALKILALVEPANPGLFHQLSRGFYELALSFEELENCRRHLLQAMRYGQEALKLNPEDPYALHLLAEIDVLFGDFPGADAKWQRALNHLDESDFREQVRRRKQHFNGKPWVESNLVDDLEAVHKAMALFASGNHQLALAILERLEEEGRFPAELPSADYFYLLGVCRMRDQQMAAAEDALQRALQIDPEHQPAKQALEGFGSGADENI